MKPVDYVVMVLVVIIAVAVGFPIVGAWVTSTELDEEGSKLLIGVVASLVAIVSTYVGARLKDKDKD